MRSLSLLETTGKITQLIHYHRTLILHILRGYIKVTFVWILDPLREAHLYIQGRMELFYYYSREKSINQDCFYEMGMLTEGFSGADINNLINESLIRLELLF